MGKGTDKLYITHSEWSSGDAYSASVGANAGERARRAAGGAALASFSRLPFNYCAASLQPFKNPVCTADGTIFDVEVIGAWLAKHNTNPVNGKPLAAKELIKLNFARSPDNPDTYCDPVTFKPFTNNTHIVAIRHGTYANVFAWETIERMNIKAKMWRDLVDDAEFGRKDIITLQDPQNAAARDLSQFKHLQEGGEGALPTKELEAQRAEGNINIDALGRLGDKVLRAKEAVARARQAREATGDVNHVTKALTASSKSSSATPTPRIGTPSQATSTKPKPPPNAARYTTGRAAASLTSTSLTPSTSSHELALLTDEEYMLKPKRVKHKGYVRIDTTCGPLTIELHTETAPQAVWNFIRLSQRGYYRGVLFHRNIANFMIQGGDPTGTGKGGQSIWGKNFPDEVDGPNSLHDGRGVVSMANKGKDTNGSQFFITYRAAKHLDRKHTVFGRVVLEDEHGKRTASADTLDTMEKWPTDGRTNRPIKEIVMRDVVVLIDPFEEFMKERKEQEDKEEGEKKKKLENKEDDVTTWTGKRVRSRYDPNHGNGDAGSGGGGGGVEVGKYLKNIQQQQQDEGGGGEVDTWEEPVRKKTKIISGGFGNFDNW